MASTDLTFIHMTDVHIQHKGADLFLGMDTAHKLSAAIDAIKSSGVDPAFFAISGDLVQDGEDDAYEHLQELLAPLDSFGVPVLLALGNHDNRVSFQRVFLNDADPNEARRYYHSHTVAGIKAIVLDSRETGNVHGTFDDAQMDWLRAELAEGLPSILIFHHPPVVTPYAMLDNHMLVAESRDKLAAAIAGHHVLAILNGHIHFNNMSSFHGVPTFAGGHVAFMLDPYEHDGMTFIDASGYNVVTIKGGAFTLNPVILPGAQTVTHQLSQEQLTALRTSHDA